MFIAAGLWLPGKAIVAQFLLQRAWQESQATSGNVKPWSWADTWPVGRLVSEQKKVDLIVLAGASGESLAFGPAHIAGSAAPGDDGHTAISGHRDTSFTFLQNLQPGDTLIVEGNRATKTYHVQDIEIVQAKDLYLDLEQSGLLSLITCYPFDAVLPNTPLRYVVTARSI